MNIKQVPAHKSNYTHRSTPKKGIVLHWIVGESADATFARPSRNASAHYSVLSDGDIHQHVKDDLIAWHAGARANPYYIGIEHAGGQLLSNGKRKHPTSKCHEASARLCAQLAKKHGMGKLQLGKNVFKHKNFMNTSCPGSLDVNKIISRANSLMNLGKLDYKLYSKNNHLYVDITEGGFVGEIQVERTSGPQKGTYVEDDIYIDRPNGGKGGKVVINMDPIRYKVIFPNNHKTFDNTPAKTDKKMKETLEELNKTKEVVKNLKNSIKEQNEKHAEEMLKDQKEDLETLEKLEKQHEKELEEFKNRQAFELNKLTAQLAERENELVKLEDQLDVELTKGQELAFDIIEEVESETNITKNKVQKWHEWVDQNIPSRKLRSILKYDIFVFFGQNIPRITIGLAAFITILQSSDIPSWFAAILIFIINLLIDLFGILGKVIATTFGDKDGELDNDDYVVIGEYVK